MSQRTVLNTAYKGLVENVAIPAEVVEREGKKYATFGSVVPIHCCTPEQVEQLSASTHHYCDIFTDELLAPLEELVYVRIDADTAEKVFINRTKRILLTSSDGVLAQWRCAATFESANHFIAGTPIVNKDGALVSVVTARKGNHYAVSTFEGDGGYIDTTQPWTVRDEPAAGSIYGDKHYDTREQLRNHVEAVNKGEVSDSGPRKAVLWKSPKGARIAVVEAGRQLSHTYLSHVIANDVEYL